jgi:hypothetical protein
MGQLFFTTGLNTTVVIAALFSPIAAKATTITVGPGGDAADIRDADGLGDLLKRLKSLTWASLATCGKLQPTTKLWQGVRDDSSFRPLGSTCRGHAH